MTKHDRDLFHSTGQVSWADMAARADVIFSPGVPEGASSMVRNKASLPSMPTPKAAKRSNAIFPGCPLKWNDHGFASVRPRDFGPGWMACAPHVPMYAAKFPNTLPEHLVKLGAARLEVGSVSFAS